MSSIKNLSRRGLLKGMAGTSAFVIGVNVTAARKLPEALGATPPAGSLAPNVFVAIASSGDVTIHAHRSEMGQGVRTSLPSVLADELEADWSRVHIEQALGDAKYGNQDTDGSRSIRQFYQPMREAGATARLMLERAAAEVWQVSASECFARLHEVHHKPTGQRLGFGSLAHIAAKLEVPAKEELTLKDPEFFRHIGKNTPIVDLPDITSGKAVYGGDIRLPGMKFAVIARPPVYGGILKSVDSAAALAIPGVESVVELPAATLPNAFNPLGGVAVIASNTWIALQGRDALVIEWEDGPNAAYNSAAFKEDLLTRAQDPARPVRVEGNVAAAMEKADKTISADYYVPHLAHAPMEPMCAIADVRKDSCEIWAATQNPQLIAGIIAGMLKMDPAKIRSHATLLGGGFGRKSKPDFAIEAVHLSKETGTPVQVQWTREDEIQHGYYHTVSAAHMEAGLDKDGNTTAWLHRQLLPSIISTFAPGIKSASDFELSQGMLDLPYDIENIQCENGEAEAHVRIGWLRSVVNIPTAFAVCSFADEIAHAAKTDPVENLLKLIGPPRNVVPPTDHGKVDNYGEPLDTYPIDTGRIANVVRLVADKADWGRKLPKGHAQGIAVHRSFLTCVAIVVEVAVAKDGTLSIPRVDIAVDCGRVVNPDRVKSQMEGAAIFGISLALYGEITATDGQIDQSNFHDYPLARMSMCPQTHVHLVESDALPTGVGEPGVPPMAPAICNAIFAATKKRIRHLPIGETIET